MELIGEGLKIINAKTHELENYISQESDSESISSNTVYSIYKDKEERIWIGTYSAGVCFTKNLHEKFKV